MLCKETRRRTMKNYFTCEECRQKTITKKFYINNMEVCWSCFQKLKRTTGFMPENRIVEKRPFSTSRTPR
jgi:hypothetical protein